MLVAGTGAQHLLKPGVYCNIPADCETSCCLDKRCAPTHNDCLALQAMQRFVEENYCSLNVDCASRCCLHGECMRTYQPCFERYDLPLITGGGVGVALAILMLFLAYMFTPSKARPKVQPPAFIEEEYIDDGGPLYYEAEQRQAEAEAEFEDDGGPLYYESHNGLIDRPP